MKSFALHTGLEQYNWTLPAISEGATKEELAQVTLIPRTKISVKQDGPVMLIPVIPVGRPIP